MGRHLDPLKRERRRKVDENETVEAEITVKFITENLTSQSSLNDDFGGNLYDLVQWLIVEEGLFGIVGDEFEVISVREKRDE